MPLPKINPIQTKSWNALTEHFSQIKATHLRDLFNDKNRFEEFHLIFDELLLDYSKNLITKETLGLLIDLANECQLDAAILSMFSGEKINETEQRSVFHTALRNRSNDPIVLEGENVRPMIEGVLSQMKSFSDRVIAGQWTGYTGKPITDVVNIGIGGSDLGPAMVVQALRSFKTRLEVHFVSNVDATHLVEVLEKLNPETTLFIVASKTFTTQETMTNAQSAKDWFLDSGAQNIEVAKHFVALSTNQTQVQQFGIDPANMFEFWDWVGGRYSLWSAIGLSISLAIGYDHFEELLEGAYQMDLHFQQQSFDQNIPVLLALIGIWYNNFYGCESMAILPYEQSLNLLPKFLQQADMESNGKSIDRNGQKINYQTGPIIWGEPGTNGQHAFYQLIHQGSKLIPSDFLAGANANYQLGDHHTKLISNFIAQTEALAFGKTENQVIEELSKLGKSSHEIDQIKMFKIFDGNKPTNSILYKQLNPKTLGSILAMYEHKIFVQGVIWNIFSFDQWGVELGKQLANQILPELQNDSQVNSHDCSTNGLINAYHKMKK